MSSSKDRLVLVEWEDSLGVGPDWQPVDDPKMDPIICRSVGWLVAEAERSILIIPHMHDADDSRSVARSGCGDMLIPKCAVLAITDLKIQPKARG